ncbi:beta-amyrin 28-monooxygenase-like [Syzygium oleosum]|uniref:beta-amyrin 28-monooxygenase-like n=1 Tax=Syzygium oleosum TaxID=219896 RepID=UPI0024BAF84C|nr:beta-amyrin 28-monooxygenase-like [Syzygium oleosum]
MDSLLPASYLLAVLIALPTLAVFLSIAKRRVSRKSSPHGTPPGQFGWPILGETLELLRAGREGRPGSFLDKRVDKHGPCVFTTSLFGEPTAVFCGAAGNKFLFGNENRKVTVSWPSSAVKLLGSCIITLAGEEGKVMRRMLMSIFDQEALRRFTMIMDEVTCNHIKANWEGKEEVLVYPTIKHYIFELTCQLFLSIRDPREIADLARPFAAFLEGVISVPVDLPGTRFHGAKRAARSIRKMLRGIIKERRAAMEKKGAASPTQDLLSYLMVTADENGRFLTESEIINNLLMLLVASHDTTSCTMTMVIKFLGELSHVYEKVLAEQREIAMQKKSAGEGLTREDVQKMRDTWSVVLEIMRLVPPVIGGFRVALEDFTFGGFTIPKGRKLMWSPLTTNNDPAVFPSPKLFNMSRFTRSTLPAPCTFVPFGGGPRMCLGKDYAQLQILVFLHHLVNNFKWTNAIPDEKVKFEPMPIPSQGLPIRIRPHYDRLRC